MAIVADFPFLSDAEFTQAGEKLRAVSEYRLMPGVIPALNITRTISACACVSKVSTEDYCDDDDSAEEEVSENDEDSTIKTRVTREDTTSSDQGRLLLVTYDIVLSPTYRVPVVYIQSKTASGKPFLDVTQLRNSIVPVFNRQAVELTGVYGALSMTEHPITGLPAYFAHPCRTADALRESSEDGKVSPMEYMMLWFGIIGTSVGLAIPASAALKLRQGHSGANSALQRAG